MVYPYLLGLLLHYPGSWPSVSQQEDIAMPYSSRPMGAALRAVCGETSTGSKIKAGLGNRAIIDIHAANIEACLPRRTDEDRSKATRNQHLYTPQINP